MDTHASMTFVRLLGQIKHAAQAIAVGELDLTDLAPQHDDDGRRHTVAAAFPVCEAVTLVYEAYVVPDSSQSCAGRVHESALALQAVVSDHRVEASMRKVAQAALVTLIAARQADGAPDVSQLLALAAA